MHDPENVWVEANIVEDQIRHLEIGQPVKLHLNAYPFEMFIGEVIGIGQVTLNDLQETQSGSISNKACLLYTSPSPRDRQKSRMPSSA